MIQSRSSLRSAIQDWLLRPDLEDEADRFVQLAEARLRRDHRVKRLFNTTLTITGPEEDLPDHFLELESIRHEEVRLGHIRIDSVQNVQRERNYWRSGGVPVVVAVTDGPRLLVGPEPDRTYEVELEWWGTFEPLNSNVLSNWLLEEHPDVYLYAALVESGPYLRDEDGRTETWNARLELALEDLRRTNENRRFAGPLSRVPSRVIGQRGRPRRGFGHG